VRRIEFSKQKALKMKPLGWGSGDKCIFWRSNAIKN